MIQKLTIIFCMLWLVACQPQSAPPDQDSSGSGIGQSEKFPFYWTFRGEEVLLLGGSDEDNLFQMTHVEEHLALLHDAGGNYVRCTMSSRDSGNVWPFKKKRRGSMI